jgi:hypothetical protein
MIILVIMFEFFFPFYLEFKINGVTTHVEQFVKIFITSLIIDFNYYLMKVFQLWMVSCMLGVGPIMLHHLIHGNI